MIKRFFSTDIPDVRVFLQEEPDNLITLNAGLRSVDLLYFDVWLTRGDSGAVTAVLFRNYWDFYLKAEAEADLEEIASFLHHLPMLGTLNCHTDTAESLLPLLHNVNDTVQCTVAVQHEPPQPLAYELDYVRVQSMEDYRRVYDLLALSESIEISRFEDYYFLRRNTDKSWTGRTYCLHHEAIAYAAASTSGECEGMALITDVATHPDYRRKGLGKALVTNLCSDLHDALMIPYVKYSTEVAAHFYDHLGFAETYKSARIYFQASASANRKLF